MLSNQENYLTPGFSRRPAGNPVAQHNLKPVVGGGQGRCEGTATMPTERTLKPPRVHNGRYTIQNTKTKEHRTFLVRTQKPGAKFAPGKRTVALLSGPDNENDYQGFAFIDDSGITVWYKRTGSAYARSHYDWYADMLWSLATVGEASAWYVKGYRLLNAASCLICNRTLTEPESLKTGIGPVCAGRGEV